jgi:hypothetical protein
MVCLVCKALVIRLSLFLPCHDRFFTVIFGIKIQAVNCGAVSDCESTDSSDSSRKGKQKLGAKVDHLLDMQHRVSPRCHASTKVIPCYVMDVAYR